MSTEPHDTGLSFRAMIDSDGTPFLNGIRTKTPPGIEIVGNGTLAHPLTVKISTPHTLPKLGAPYDQAPALVKAVEDYLKYGPRNTLKTWQRVEYRRAVTTILREIKEAERAEMEARRDSMRFDPLTDEEASILGDTP